MSPSRNITWFRALSQLLPCGSNPLSGSLHDWLLLTISLVENRLLLFLWPPKPLFPSFILQHPVRFLPSAPDDVKLLFLGYWILLLAVKLQNDRSLSCSFPFSISSINTVLSTQLMETHQVSILVSYLEPDADKKVCPSLKVNDCFVGPLETSHKIQGNLPEVFVKA